MSSHASLLDVFQQRLNAAVNRSPLLRLSSGGTRLLDCARLAEVDPDAPRQLLDSILSNRGGLLAQFRMQAEAEWSRRQAESHKTLYELLERRIRRQAELARRETGVPALWLGYPLFSCGAKQGDSERAVFAPLLLWPLAIEPDLRHAGRLRLKRDGGAGPVRVNRVLWAWLQRHWQVEPAQPDAQTLAANEWPGLPDYLAEFAASFEGLSCPDWSEVPGPLDPRAGRGGPPTLHHSAALGYWRWPNEAILQDLEALKSRTTPSAPLSALLDAESPPTSPPPSPPPEEQRYLVFDADFSQQQVIWRARRGPGLVAHGPPGTGKSQTIANIIADRLARGERVLMVCQKQAALQVVHERLREVGLDGLCLMIRDPESDRLPTFRAVREQVEHLPPELPPPDEELARRAQLAEQIAALEKELNGYLRALRAPHPRLGLAYRDTLARQGELFNQYPGLRGAPELRQVLEDVPVRELEDVLERVESLGNLFGQADPLRNPWRHHRSEVGVSPALRSDVARLAQELRELDGRHLATIRERRERLGLGWRADASEMPETLPLPSDLAKFPARVEQRLRELEQLAGLRPAVDEEQARLSRLARAWLRALRHLDGLGLARHREQIQRVDRLLGQALEVPPPDPRWRELCRRLDAEAIETLGAHARRLLRRRRNWWRFLSPGFYHARQALEQLLGSPIADPDLSATAETLLQSLRWLRHEAELAHAGQTLVPGEPCFSTSLEGRREFVEAAREALDQALAWQAREREQPWLTPCLDALARLDWDGLQDLLDTLRHSLQRVPLAEIMLQTLERFEHFLRPQALSEPAEKIRAGQSIAPWLERVERGLNQMGPLLSLESDRSQRGGLAAKVLAALEAVETRRLHQDGPGLPQPPEDLPAEQYGRWWSALLRFNAAAAWQQRMEREVSALLEFTPEGYKRKAARLEELFAHKQQLEARGIRRSWLARQQGLRNRPWKRLFQLRASKHGQAKRLREAVQLGLEENLLDLRPCWLTNPETAAQLFPLQAELFDLVIFDEASQCPLEQALPAIHRGRVTVICGDEKQLPPTSFFTAQVDGEEDWEDGEEEAEATRRPVEVAGPAARRRNREFLLQAEDLLQAGVGVFPESYLRVHYRSLHPALIEFSNRAFYGGLLEAPPAVGGAPRHPLTYHEVGGQYQRRANPAEAERVVTLLRGLQQSEETVPSLGVITFNQTQRGLIEDALERACQEDAGFAAWYQQQLQRRIGDRDLGLFVKNLENVQGDERDWILFSTTFGPDENGRFYRYFGPAGAAGGERRLNVAVTRARQRLIILGSMPLEQIADALAGRGAGELTPAGYLQLYLAYARAWSAGDDETVRAILQRLDGGLGQTSAESDPETHPLVEDLRANLHAWGYVCETGIGGAGFRLDLAVRHPDPEQGYLLGIICDGGPYLPERGARLQGVWRERLLSLRGWRLYPVWSTRWWQSREDELQRLRQVLHQAGAEAAPDGGT